MDVQSKDLISSALRGAANKLAQDPVLIDVSQRLGIAESFLLVSAPSSRQVRAIAEEIMDEIGRDYHIIPQRIEGRSEGTWVLADYGDVVIHVMSQEDREFYALERLWSDQTTTRLELPDVSPGAAVRRVMTPSQVIEEMGE